MAVADNTLDPSVLEELIDKALSSGASYAEARYHVLRGHFIGLMNERVITAGYENLAGVGIRVIYSGGLGFASTNRLDRKSLLSTVEKALKAAKTSSSMVRKPVRMAPSKLGRARYRVWEKKPLSSYTLDEKLDIIKDKVKNVDKSRFGIEIKQLTVFYQELSEYKIIINSDGGSVESWVPRGLAFYNISAKYEDKTRNRFGTIAWSGGLEKLDEKDLTGTLMDDIRSLDVALRKAKPSPKGKMDVILSPELVGIAVHESIGHPSEADRILGREAAQAGLSYWRDIGIGHQLGSEHVTIVDDPTIPGSFGFYLYDDETVKAGPRYLLYKGIITDLLHNRETASEYGVESNGSARARDYKSEPIVRMANTFVVPGEMEPEELFEGVKEGIYIKKYMEWNIDDYRWAARYVGLEAYVVRNGRIEEPVRDPVLEITSPRFWSSIDAVAKDLELYPGFCGKGEPIQGIPVTLGGPHIRLRSVEVR